MQQIEWNSSLEIGDEFIDLQHHTFVVLVARTAKAIERRAPHGILMKTLYEIKKYAEFHFVSEENFMAEVGYPDYLEHERVHSHLLSELSLKIAECNRDDSCAKDALDFLYRWLLVHIATEDKKITAHMQRRAERG